MCRYCACPHTGWNVASSRCVDKSCKTPLLEISAARALEGRFFRCPLCARRYTTSPVCFHIDCKYELKYDSRPSPFTRYSFRVIDSQRNYSATMSRYRTLILFQLLYESEREVDGVRSKSSSVSRKYSLIILLLWRRSKNNVYVIYCSFTWHVSSKIIIKSEPPTL